MVYRRTSLPIVNRLVVKEARQFAVSLLLVVISGQVLVLDRLTQVVVKEVEDAVPVHQVVNQTQVERRPHRARLLKNVTSNIDAQILLPNILETTT